MIKAQSKEVKVPAGAVQLPGYLEVPANALGLVVFAHGSGSGRLSPRNRFVARELNASGLATLLFDLLTPYEESDRENRFDVELLSDRLSAAVQWLRADAAAGSLPMGLFGASTGAAAALIVAAHTGKVIRAVVSRGGRPDLAAHVLKSVRCPVLLIVGGMDHTVAMLNQEAYNRLECEKELALVPGATHLFEEPGALERVARTARDWFCRYLPLPSD